MRPVSLRWTLGTAALVGLVALTACSKPAEAPYSKAVSIDGYHTTATVKEEDSTRIAACTSYGKSNDVRYTYTLFDTSDGAEDVVYKPVHPVTAGGADLTTDAWNKDLVLYAHGFIDPNDTTPFTDYLGQAEFVETRDRLLCEGYALGASSFAEKGYAIQAGIEDTHLINPIFADYYQQPDHTYIFGSSMGGLITVALAEKFPSRYAGGMPTCGPIGGSLLEFNYVGNERLLFDHFLPGPGGTSYLGGDLLNPDESAASNLATLINSAATANPSGFDSLVNTWLSITSLGGVALPSALTMPAVQTPQAYGLTATDLGVPSYLMPYIDQYALGRALRYQVVGTKDLIAKAGGSPFDNTATTYEDLTATSPTWEDWTQLTGDPPYAPDAAAVTHSLQYYQPTGDTKVPLLVMHTYIDPDVPLYHVYTYAALAASHPSTDLKIYVVLGIVPYDLRAQVALLFPGLTLPDTSPFGHCNFAVSDLAAGLGILVSHVEQGTPWPDPGSPGVPASFGALPALPTP